MRISLQNVDVRSLQHSFFLFHRHFLYPFEKKINGGEKEERNSGANLGHPVSFHSKGISVFWISHFPSFASSTFVFVGRTPQRIGKLFLIQ